MYNSTDKTTPEVHPASPGLPGRVISLYPPESRTSPSKPAPLGRPAKILFVIDELDIGGTEQQILELSRGLDRERFEPTVCCFRHGRKALEIESLGVPVLHLKKRAKADFSLPLRLARLMRRDKYDLVQTYLWTANTWGRIAALLARVPVVVASERNVDIWEEAYKRFIGRRLAGPTNSVIANSEAVRDYLLSRGGLNPDRVTTIYNGVNFDRFRNPPDPVIRRSELGLPEGAILAVCIARIEAAKDHDTLLEALALAAPRTENLHVAIVGDGGQRARLEAKAAELGLADRVHFTGFRTDAAAWLSSCDLSVLSSVKEGLSNTVIESMAAGKPAVATSVGGNPEVILDGRTGFLVPPKRPDLLADKLAIVVSDSALRRRMGEAGRLRVQELFSVPRMVEQTQTLYDALLGHARRQGRVA